mmetsp:Transcript_13687/g.48308  ORF Transcript_13687/g.48308 Transcript_13687/m.48308 type:complete len:370 (-) Transcript_13687:1442-2551(-)
MIRLANAAQNETCSVAVAATVCPNFAIWSAFSWPLASRSLRRLVTISRPMLSVSRSSARVASLKPEAQKSKIKLSAAWPSPSGSSPCVSRSSCCDGNSLKRSPPSSKAAATNKGRQAWTLLMANTTLMSCVLENSFIFTPKTSEARVYKAATPSPSVPPLAFATASKSFDASSTDQPGNVMAAAAATASRALSATAADLAAATVKRSKRAGCKVSIELVSLERKAAMVRISSPSAPRSPKPAVMLATRWKGASCRMRSKSRGTFSSRRPPFTMASSTWAAAAGSAFFSNVRAWLARYSAMGWEAGRAWTVEFKIGSTFSSGWSSNMGSANFFSFSEHFFQGRGIAQIKVNTSNVKSSFTSFLRTWSDTR